CCWWCGTPSPCCRRWATPARRTSPGGGWGSCTGSAGGCGTATCRPRRTAGRSPERCSIARGATSRLISAAFSWPAKRASRKANGMTAQRCTCGFTEANADDETIVDHLLRVFTPDDDKGADGQVHLEGNRELACLCGFRAGTTGELDSHFLE